MKRFKIITILFLSLLVTTVSCDNDFEEINTDPNNPTTVPSSLLIPGIARAAQNRSYSTFTGGDMGACWSQQFAKVQYNDEARYIPRQSVITAVWDDYYAIVISDADAMYNIAESEGNNTMMGVALTLQAYGYAFLTDCYGSIPFTEAITADEGNIAPAYDTQDVVYSGIFSMLDKAISLIGTGGSIDETNDVVYGGDATKWKKFAASLKFRALMRVSGKMNVSSALQALVDSGNLFASNDDEAKLVYLDEDPSANPLYETIVYGTRGEWKVNSVLVDMLASTSDPRLEVYAALNDADIYRGKPSGYTDVPNDDYNYTNVSALGEFYLRPQLPGYFVSNAELKFLMAEAATKGYISGTANDYFIEGITASMDFNGVDGSAYISGQFLQSNTATALQQIAEQNWIALFAQGVESWTEWRRTGYPVLSPAFEADLNEIPSRYNYPTTESSINKANYDAAVAAQGADELTTPVWWMN
ncbi:SusD/RagB family nutrient-binding outer membrane lipoprotein [Lutibacter sp. TH_r2]|uniref:SusD/RagB family nutrient-binding outer membrane lipoprotein n=1 Tax=Lutibacter sp. TH_r2 TaxID=3082083 RepID=UPI002953E46E|nr:SusD/RagB family nutrient-binding outer membrane lipoprotein [Lutibacter sp. TH_r2]MDV7185764.1 SusD/RagB family nutrient-binding outer membrane lipoprotein [Lutibacter sp. TH_r2]